MSGYFTDENISIKQLADIVDRPRYQASVAPRKSQFRLVLASYSFPRKVACCSVSDCYQNHKKGYLVRTADGEECSICERCAQRFFEPEALKPPKRRRSPVRTAGGARRDGPAAPVASRQLTAESFAAESLRIRERVKTLKQMEQGANWLFQSLSNFCKACPPEVLTALEAWHTDGEESWVFAQLIDANASDDQLQDVEQLQGLEVFGGEDIRTLLVDNLLKPLGLLEQQAAKTAADGWVRVPDQWADQVEANLLAAERLLAAGRRFFTEENIARLRSLPLAEPVARTLRSLRWDCQQGCLKS